MAERAMPRFRPSPPELVERFGAVLEDYPTAVRRKMFGYPAAFVGGNMATGLFADQWVVRLPDAEIAALLGCRVGTVASLVHRALARLRSEIEP